MSVAMEDFPRRHRITVDDYHVDVSLRNRKSRIVTLTTHGLARLEQLERVEQRWHAGLTRGFTDQEAARTAWVIRVLRERLGE